MTIEEMYANARVMESRLLTENDFHLSELRRLDAAALRPEDAKSARRQPLARLRRGEG